MMVSARSASDIVIYLLLAGSGDSDVYSGLSDARRSLKAGRRGVEDGLDRLRQGARRLLAELDGHPAGRSELGGEEVDVERVAERRVHRVVQVDGAIGHFDPAGRALGAALDRDLLGYVRAHVQGFFR